MQLTADFRPTLECIGILLLRVSHSDSFLVKELAELVDFIHFPPKYSVFIIQSQIKKTSIITTTSRKLDRETQDEHVLEVLCENAENGDVIDSRQNGHIPMKNEYIG
ncbi:unnamed protein product [Acanthoscelides obtectus]|uniref:Uncharacterized protein n=1 Tax=Acanthoscelides obtectus TaxID=200917 RepID=A0A9P0JG74_ACAOB|nr:unnamed protein product [Acanthoscelides obtectus]CAK1661289.1 hypothetical protein AOBTE_LOCUS22550 [Acanthoscelides obtectus]